MAKAGFTVTPSDALSGGPSIRRPRWSRLSRVIIARALTLILSAFAAWVWILWRFAVDVPIMDQWDTPAIQIIAFWEGRLSWDLLTGQHNDSRKLIPNLISLALALAVDSYRPGYEVFITLGLGAVITASLVQLARQTGLGPVGSISIATLYVGLSLAPRSLIVHLHSLNFERLIPDAMLLLALLTLTGSRLSWWRLIAAATASGLAQFSIAGGLVLWPLLGLQIAIFTPLGRMNRALVTGLWGVFAGISLWAYFAGFKIPYPDQPRPPLGEVPLVDFIRFLSGFFGNALSANMTTAILTGSAMLIAFLGLLLVITVSPKHRCTSVQFTPWLVVAALPISQAALVTFGRLPDSIAHAFRDDYAHYGVFLPVATAALALMLAASRDKQRYQLVAVACLFVAATLLAGLAGAGFHDRATAYWRKFSFAKACLVSRRQLAQPACLDALFPRRTDRLPRFMRATGILTPGLPKHLPIGANTPGAVDSVARHGGQFQARGWASLDNHPADAVALACIDKDSRKSGPAAPRMIALTKVNKWRPDLAHWRRHLGNAGWSFNLSETPDCATLEIFAVDADRGQLRRLTPP